MPQPHRGSLRGGDTHLSCDLTLTGILELLLLGRTDGQKNRIRHLHFSWLFSQSCPDYFFTIIFFFFFLQKKNIGLETFHFMSLVWKICFVETFIPLQHSPLHFIFISISFSVFLFIACEILPFSSNNFFFCSLDFGIATCAPLDVDQTVWTGDIITSWNEKSDLNPLCWLCLHFGPKSPFLGAKCDRWPDKQFVMHHFVLSAQELSTDQLLCPLLETAFAIVFTQKSPLRSFGIFFPRSLALATMVWVFSSTNTPNIPSGIPAQHLVLKSL